MRLTKAQLLNRNPVAQALRRRPVPAAIRCDMSLAAHVSLDEALRGTATVEHRDALASVVNTMMMLTRDHCDEASQAVVIAARDAMLRADARAKAGGHWGLDGAGIQALRDAVGGQDDLVGALGVRDVSVAILEAEARTPRMEKMGFFMEDADAKD